MLELLFAGMLLARQDAASPAANQIRPATVKALADDYLTAKAVGSLSVAVVRPTSAHCYSVGSSNARRAANPDTVYEIGSVTKTFTGLLLAQATVEGRLGLNDPVTSRLSGDYRNLAFENRPVTLGHLANMTSGLPDNLPARSEAENAMTPRDRSFARAMRLETYSNDQFLGDLAGATVSTAPGEATGHSNVAAELLGHILETTYQTPYLELVTGKIEAEAGMTGPREGATVADSLNLDGETMPYLTASTARASAGLRYSVSDMARYARLHLDESRPAVRLAHQPSWKTLDGEMGIGLGWIWHKDGPAGRRLRASGGTFGFASFVDIYPDQGLALVLLTNGADDPTQGELQALSEAIATTVTTSDPADWARDAVPCG